MDEKEVIEDILDEFDFGRVQQVMEALDWKWGGDPAEVPSLGQLRKKARSLMQHCIGHDTYRTATGGFDVQKDTVDVTPYYSLKFVVSEWDNYE